MIFIMYSKQLPPTPKSLIPCTIMWSRLFRLVKNLSIFNSDSDDEELNIVSRAEWKARVPKWREDLVYPALSVDTVYTGTPPCNSPEECTRAVQDLQATHMDQDGLPDIEYSFLVGGDGRIYEGRGWHTLSNRNTLVKCVDPEFPPPPVIMNKDMLKFSPDRRVVVAFIGDEKKNKATIEMENAARDLVEYGVEYFYIYSGEEDSFSKTENLDKDSRAQKRKELEKIEESDSD